MKLVSCLLLFLFPLMILFLQWSLEAFAVDRCLDRGGAYDYREGVCRTDGAGGHLYVPYLERHFESVFFLSSLSVLGLVGFLLLRFGRRRPGIVS